MRSCHRRMMAEHLMPVDKIDGHFAQAAGRWIGVQAFPGRSQRGGACHVRLLAFVNG